MTSPVQLFRAFPRGRRRFLEAEAALVLLLVALALFLNDRGDLPAAVALVAEAYAVGLTTHLVLVLFGREPRFVQRARNR